MIGFEVVTWIEDDRTGTLLRGGIAGGGPRFVTEFWDWSRGGIWGSLPFAWSGGAVFDVMLDVRCRMADFAFDMDCVMELCEVFVCGCTDATVVTGFCGWIFTICGLAWAWVVFTGTLLLAACCATCVFAATIEFYTDHSIENWFVCLKRQKNMDIVRTWMCRWQNLHCGNRFWLFEHFVCVQSLLLLLPSSHIREDAQHRISYLIGLWFVK